MSVRSGTRWLWFAAVILLAGLASSGCPGRKAAPPGGIGEAPIPGAEAPGGIGEKELEPGGRVKEWVEGKEGAEGGPLGDVHFEFDSFELSAEARRLLEENARWLEGNAAARVEIEGHCDDRGTNQYNLALGAKRATAAKDYLVTLGVSADRLSTISYGEELPLCQESTEECWHRNRRAHFLVLTD